MLTLNKSKFDIKTPYSSLFFLIGQKWNRIFYFFFVSLLFSASLYAQRSEFKLLPVIKYDKTYGAYFRLIGAYLDQELYLPKEKNINYIAGSVLYTTKGYWGIDFGQKSFLFKDKLRFTTVLSYNTAKSVIEMNDEQSLNEYENYNELSFFLYTEPQYQIIKYSYLGARYENKHARITFDSDSIGDGKQHLQALGLSYVFDNNEDYFNRLKGFYVSFGSRHYWKFLNNDNIFSKYELTCNYYKILQNKKRPTILASRLVAKVGTGNVPFYESYIVKGIDLRGYTKQRYRGKQFFAVQSELRTYFTPHFGVAGFLGVGLPTNSAKDIRFEKTLLSVGGGIRFIGNQNKRIFSGIDFAVGKGDWGVYFRIGESF